MVNQFNDHDLPMFANHTVLSVYGVDDQDKWANLGYLSAFFVLFTVMTWFTLSFRRFSSR